MKFLSCLQRETVFLEPQEDPSTMPMDARDLRTEKMVQGSSIIDVCEAAEPVVPEGHDQSAKPSDRSRLPRNLLEARL